MDIFALKNVVLSFFKFEFIFLFHEFYVFHDFLFNYLVQKHQLFLELPGIVYANLQLTTELQNVRFFASFRYFGGFRMMSKITIDSHLRAKIAILMLSQT